MLLASSRLAAVLGFLSIFALATVSAQPGKKAAVPSPAEQSKVETLIQELYKSELDKAVTDPALRARLAVTFLQEGKDTADDVTARYVLYRYALRFATLSGDAPTALQAIDDLAQDFGLPAPEVFQMKIQALGRCAADTSTADANQTVVDSALVLLEDALSADDFPSARELLKTAESAGRRLKNVALVSSIRKRGDDIGRLEKEFARWQPFADRLAKNPNDAEANAEMGKYQAILKGNWERGLPLLAKGGQANLKLIAGQDLLDPKDWTGQKKLADGYYALVKSYDGVMQVNVLLRAYHWYQHVVADVAAPETVRGPIEKRMRDIMERVPAEYRVGEITTELKKCDGHFGPVYCTALSPDGRKAISASSDGSLRLWDTKTGKELKRLEGHAGRVWTVAFAPDGRRVASGGFDNSIRIWDLTSGREIRRLPGHGDYVRSVVFSSDGHLILSGGDDRLVRLWNADTGKEIRTFTGHSHFVWSVALSRDGKRALSASLDKTARLWDVETGSELKRLEGHKDTVLAVAFSPDGRRALTGSTDGTLKLWDLGTAKEVQTFTGHKGYVHSVAFSPDGRRILSASADHTLRLWDAASGQELRTLEGHRDQVWFVTFARDGRLAASASQDQTVRIWGGAK